MFINRVEPFVHMFEPNSYVQSWIRNTKIDSDDLCCPKIKTEMKAIIL